MHDATVTDSLLRKLLDCGYVEWGAAMPGETEPQYLVVDGGIEVTPEERAVIEAIWAEDDDV